VSCQPVSDSFARSPLPPQFHTVPDLSLDTIAAMAPSDELEYLKSLVGQLNEKIKSLEEKAKSVVKPKTPAQQLRAILVGPPGSGSSAWPSSRGGRH
jgi:hypothetical protein